MKSSLKNGFPELQKSGNLLLPLKREKLMQLPLPWKNTVKYFVELLKAKLDLKKALENAFFGYLPY
jgi:hypothetical protein